METRITPRQKFYQERKKKIIIALNELRQTNISSESKLLIRDLLEKERFKCVKNI